jgi:hypothetical protein
MAMTLAILISPTNAQTTCTSTSPECCWVVESWKKMGKITSASSTNATACCNTLLSSNGSKITQTYGTPGVTCTSIGNVTEINWHNQGLRGSIPPELGSLLNLRSL